MAPRSDSVSCRPCGIASTVACHLKLYRCVYRTYAGLHTLSIEVCTKFISSGWLGFCFVPNLFIRPWFIFCYNVARQSIYSGYVRCQNEWLARVYRRKACMCACLRIENVTQIGTVSLYFQCVVYRKSARNSATKIQGNVCPSFSACSYTTDLVKAKC